MAKKKNKKTEIPNKIILVNGFISVECPKCLGKAEDCEQCEKKGFIWMKKHTGETKKTEKNTIHTVYIIQK